MNCICGGNNLLYFLRICHVHIWNHEILYTDSAYTFNFSNDPNPLLQVNSFLGMDDKDTLSLKRIYHKDSERLHQVTDVYYFEPSQ